MKINYISDLHVDFRIRKDLPSFIQIQKIREFCDELLPKEIGDVLIIPGDISHSNFQIKEVLEYFSTIYKRVYFCIGNHDLYIFNNSEFKTSIDRVKDLFESIRNNPKIHFFNGEVVKFEGIKFLGSPIWYDGVYSKNFFNLHDFEISRMWKRGMSDSSCIILNEGKKCSLNELKEMFFDLQYKFLLVHAKECQVVFTHVPSSWNHILGGPFERDPLSGFFCFDGRKLIESCDKNTNFISGHTHIQTEYEIEGVNIKINSLGYPGENKNIKIKGFKVC